ncbi:MAG: hypothetical protein MI919_09515, partial [Holophagales bacterium]|nr:hypothetical protein [Holophagales bacterium]
MAKSRHSKPGRGVRKRRSGKIARRPPWVRRLALAVAVLTVAAGAWLFWPFWQLSGQFGNHPIRQPSRLYARPPVIEPGQAASLEELERKVRDSGYR